MGGKSSTSQQTVAIPPQILAQYASVNAKADQTANTPFQTYGGEFVAPVNSQQQAGITGTNAAATEAQPYYQAATSQLESALGTATPYNEAAAYGTAASAAPLTGSQIQQYLSPYLGTVLGSESQLLNQNNQQQQAGQLGDAISSGAFGGDRTGIAAANLEQQQNMANSNIYSNILNTGYQSALGTAQGQQQIGLQGAQQLANIGQTQYGEGANTASELGALGSGAQSAGLQGAQAQLGAGTLEQQTQQAQDTALYNQFEQQQSYPFQVDQFLANIAEGTGALSGSTTTTTQPGGFFSDERLKHSKRPVGKTFDGQTIYAYQMHGDPRTRMGLLAQEVERKHPEAVGLAAGYKTVDYGKATHAAANRGHFHDGGVVPLRRAAGGATDLDAILAAQQQMYAGLGGARMRGINGLPRGGAANVPAPSGGSPQLITAQGGLQARPTGMQNATALGQAAKNYEGLYKDFGGKSPSTWFGGGSTTTTTTPGGLSPGVANAQANPSVSGADLGTLDQQSYSQPAALVSNAADERRGGRIHRDAGGDTPYSDDGGLSIPDENPHNTLSKPAQLPPPSPTGFQQLMGSLGGGGGGGMGGLGSMFSGMGGSGGGDASGLISDAYSGGASDVGDGAIDVLSEAGARGGRMKRDDGGGAFDADSAPNSASLGDAPDTSLAQAPALKQGAPNTSLDSVKHLALAAGEAYIGDYPGAAMQLYDTYNSAKSKRGGRIGKADAGAVTGDGGLGDDPDLQPIQTTAQLISNSGTLPEVESPSGGPKFSGLAPDSVTYNNAGLGAAPTPSVDDGQPRPKPVDIDSGSQTPLWDKIKGELAKPSNLIPIIAGIGAMGTAPTRSLGTALAAGLSGAAQSYVPTQQGLAQAQGQQIQNQMMGLRAKAMGDYFNNSGSASSTMPPTRTYTPPKIPDGATAGEIDQAYRNTYAVAPPGALPQERTLMDAAQNQSYVLGSQMPVLKAKQDQQNRYNADLFASQQAAQQEAAALYPAVAAGDKAATIRYNALFPHTGDKYIDLAGREVNSRNFTPAVGAAAQQLTPQQQLELAKPVNYGAAQSVPLAKYASQNGVPIPPAGTPGTDPMVPNAPMNSPGVPPTRAPVKAASSSTMDFSDAPAKPAWADNPSVVTSDDQKPLKEEYGKKKAELLAESGQAKETQEDLIRAKRMLNVLPNAKTGPGTDTMSKWQAILGNMTGSQFASWLDSDPSAHALLAKGLGTNALDTTLDDLRGRGANVRLGTQESALILNKLSASPDMPRAAISSLLNWQIQQANYDLGRQNAIRPYLAQGKDAMQFDNYYANKVKPSSVMTTEAPAGIVLPRPAPPTPTIGTVRGNFKYVGGDPADKGSWQKVAS